MTTVRDKLWIFASRAHDDDIFFLRAKEQPKACWSRITPAEGAFMLGVPNMIMVESDGVPCPYTEDAFGYLESCCRIKKLLWSTTGSAGFRNGNEEEFIRDMAEKYPNICGAYFDDFHWDYKTKLKRTEPETRELFSKVRKTIDNACRPMESWATVYVNQLKDHPQDFYDDLDGVIMWNIGKIDPDKVEDDFKQFEEYLPDKKIMMGIYLINYNGGESLSVPDEVMEAQCELALRLLKEKRIEGIVFLTNCVMGIGLTSEYYVRNWIDKVGDIELE